LKLRFVIVTALVALFGALTLGPAAAATKYPSSVTIARDPGGVGFHGTVTSQGPPACEQHRLVKLFRFKGNLRSAQRVADDRSDTSGFYDVLTSLHKGTYFTVAKRRVLRNRGDAVCQAAVSRTIRVG
jgi:hypothetical protein